MIEVGIDVPNASVMLVKDADRYGIRSCTSCAGASAAGRTRRCACSSGRRSPPGCAPSPPPRRLELAEIDLELRGEGELVGTRQSGLQAFCFAQLPGDAELLDRARDARPGAARREFELSDQSHVLLGEALLAAFGADALEPIPA